MSDTIVQMADGTFFPIQQSVSEASDIVEAAKRNEELARFSTDGHPMHVQPSYVIFISEVEFPE